MATTLCPVFVCVCQELDRHMTVCVCVSCGQVLRKMLSVFVLTLAPKQQVCLCK